MVPQILDVTLRDGGYVNDWRFPQAASARMVSALSRAGVPLIELGYYRPRLAELPEGAAGSAGPKCCRREYLKSAARAVAGSRLGVMVHLGDVRLDEYAFLADHGISLVRFILGTGGAPGLEAHIAAAHRAGLTCSVNLIRVSERTLESIVARSKEAEAMGADWLYTADSNGSMFPERVEEIYRALLAEVRVPLGYHAHDNLNLALANSLAAMRGGAQLLDSSLGGMGKGAGNLVTELILSYLKRFCRTPFEVAPLVALTCEVLSDWVDASGHWQSCESTLSALLNLNIDDRKELQAAADRANRPLLHELEYSIDALARRDAMLQGA